MARHPLWKTIKANKLVQADIAMLADIDDSALSRFLHGRRMSKERRLAITAKVTEAIKALLAHRAA